MIFTSSKTLMLYELSSSAKYNTPGIVSLWWILIHVNAAFLWTTPFRCFDTENQALIAKYVNDKPVDVKKSSMCGEITLLSSTTIQWIFLTKERVFASRVSSATWVAR